MQLKAFFEGVPFKELGDRIVTFREAAEYNFIDIYTPSAALMPYSPAMGLPMSVWFDRSSSFNLLGRGDQFEDLQGIDDSIAKMLDFIADLSDEYDAIIIGGFSQGGSLCLNLARYLEQLPEKVLGIFAMGSYLIESSSVFQQPGRMTEVELETHLGDQKNTRKMPLLMMHGNSDLLPY